MLFPVYKIFNTLLILSVFAFCISCSDNADDDATGKKIADISNQSAASNINNNETIESSAEDKDISIEETAPENSVEKPKFNYNKLRTLITYGKATIIDVKQALTETDVVGLSNTLHALYSMRWHRGVYHLYYDLWNLEKDKYPDLAWESLEKVPARIALASTINRVQIYNTEEYKNYIRAHEHDENEFHRAQVVVALGLNGDPDDVEYIKSMADGDNHYVAQSAISSLAMAAHVKAQDAMIELYEKYKGTARGNLLLSLLKKSYRWEPEENIK